MGESDDNKFMRRCVELASFAEGRTYPNPLVGSVIVHEGKIIGEGYHLKAGGPHAEVIAINSVENKDKLKHSTLYVNLEPCSHFGKTPPCADYIIANSIPRVVVGTLDTSEKVSGRGVDKLRNTHCEVIIGVIENECRRVNRRFFAFIEKRRPYITLKWAQSADGYIDVLRSEGHEPRPTWISGKPERILVHKWRASEQVILVGAGTIRADKPKLNVREWKGNNPIKIVLSGSGNVDTGSVRNEPDDKVIIFTHNSERNIPGAVNVKLSIDEPASIQILRYLHDIGIQSLFIEGGAKILNHFISNGLWDEARIFKGPGYFGGGVKAPAINGQLLSETSFSGSLLETYLNDGDHGSLMIDY
jgi:diaminohydroxyphosphoribosylaminopyrimidine deaminase / 5-amino-6-(5-phosphoribosylamino)uracil reductase